MAKEIHSQFCSGRSLETFEYVLMSTLLVLALIPYLHGVRWFCRNFNKVHKIFSLSYIFIGLGFITFSTTSILAVYSCWHISDDAQRVFRIIGFQGYVFEIEISIIVVLWRLKVSFAGTHYAIKDNWLKRNMILIICQWSIAGIGICLAVWFSEKNEIIYKIGSYSLSFGYIMYLVIFFIILRGFIKTLIAFVIDRQKQKYHEYDRWEFSSQGQSSITNTPVLDKPASPSANSSQLRRTNTNTMTADQVEIDRANKKLLKTATKYFSLGLVVFITTLFGIITSAFQAFIKTYLVTNLVNFAVGIDGYINFLCLFLQYQFSMRSYKCLCRGISHFFGGLIHQHVYKHLAKAIEAESKINGDIMSETGNDNQTQIELKGDNNQDIASDIEQNNEIR